MKKVKENRPAQGPKARIGELLLIIAGLALMVAGGAGYFLHYMEGVRGEEGYERLRDLTIAVDIQEDADEEEALAELEKKPDPQPWRAYGPVFAENEDMKAWLQIPGSNIDYPVMQTPEDEEFYLRRDFYKNKSSSGSLLLAGADDIDRPSAVLTIYGHNMRNGSMFGSLSRYRDPAYRDRNDVFILYTIDQVRYYRPIAAFDLRILEEGEKGFAYYEYRDARDQALLDAYLATARVYDLWGDRQEDMQGDIDRDQFLLLSTCRGRAGSRDRFVVMAKRIYE